jgi:hypothetical protein
MPSFFLLTSISFISSEKIKTYHIGQGFRILSFESFKARNVAKKQKIAGARICIRVPTAGYLDLRKSN